MNLPNPLGTTTNDFAMVDVVDTVVSVKVINWPAATIPGIIGKTATTPLPPPLPRGAVPPPLPGQSFQLHSPPPLPQDRPDVLKVKVMNQSPVPVTLASGSITGVGKAVNKPGPINVPKAGGGLELVAGLGKVAGALFSLSMLMVPFNATFAQLIGAVHGGVSSGFGKGSGADVLGNAASALGVALGVNVLPAVIELSAELLELAEDFTITNRSIREFRKDGKQMGDTFDNSGKKINRGEGDTRDWLDMFDDWTDRFAERNNFWHSQEKKDAMKRKPAGDANKPPTPPLNETPEEKAARERSQRRDKFKSMVVQSLEASLGPQAGYHGVADVRQQAQLAAMEDPIVRMSRTMIVEMLQDWKANGGAKNVQNIANNTKPPAA